MNTLNSRPRLTRGAHDPAAHAYSIVGLFSQIIPLLAYIGRTLNDTMCDHRTVAICDRCQRHLYTLGILIEGSSAAVAGWTVVQLAELKARLALAAARRLVDTVELGEPVSWAMAGGSVVTTARRAINAGAALLDAPELGAHNEARFAAKSCMELDQSTTRVARKRGLERESLVIGNVLKAASKAAEAAVAAVDVRWAARMDAAGEWNGGGVEFSASKADYAAGAAVGAALDGAAALIGTGRAESMMVVATGVCAEFERRVELERDTPKDTFGKSSSQAKTIETPTEEYNVMSEYANEPAATEVWGGPYLDRGMEIAIAEAKAAGADFEESEIADVADEAIGDAASAYADLERAEAILNAIAEEHRPVQQLVRTSRDNGADAGQVTEYFADCCVMCRDAKGRPVPSPCRTAKILQSYGEGLDA